MVAHKASKKECCWGRSWMSHLCPGGELYTADCQHAPHTPAEGHYPNSAVGSSWFMLLIWNTVWLKLRFSVFLHIKRKAWWSCELWTLPKVVLSHHNHYEFLFMINPTVLQLSRYMYIITTLMWVWQGVSELGWDWNFSTVLTLTLPVPKEWKK